ncbi:hypothetical protein ES695_10960 [Candidatus Atribacteria bacterium 1244-E10-H5-B2]|nr:MAG: hypothetical protein ES695_10960 [Candidatus Atribacteria bacterium 1244-E10-H5-B2]
MPEYLCPKCRGVFCGWVMRYRYKQKCPVCGSELQEVSNNKKYRKDEGFGKGQPKISRCRV